MFNGSYFQCQNVSRSPVFNFWVRWLVQAKQARVAVKSVKCQTRLWEILTLFPEIKTFFLLLSWGQRVGHLSNFKLTLSTDKSKAGKVWLTGFNQLIFQRDNKSSHLHLDHTFCAVQCIAEQCTDLLVVWLKKKKTVSLWNESQWRKQ